MREKRRGRLLQRLAFRTTTGSKERVEVLRGHELLATFASAPVTMKATISLLQRTKTS